jgi:hypothetical protein
MTGVVLALAGLAAGDGGTGTGATQEAVAINLAGEWEGTWRSRRGFTYAAQLRGGVIRAFSANGRARFAFRVIRDGDGRLRITDGGSRTWLGIYRLDDQCLVICSAAGYEAPRPNSFFAPDTDLFTLRPAAPRKR